MNKISSWIEKYFLREIHGEGQTYKKDLQAINQTTIQSSISRLAVRTFIFVTNF